MENTSCVYHQTLMMAAKVPKKLYKVVAVASQSATGKTAFIQRFCQDKYMLTEATIYEYISYLSRTKFMLISFNEMDVSLNGQYLMRKPWTLMVLPLLYRYGKSPRFIYYNQEHRQEHAKLRTVNTIRKNLISVGENSLLKDTNSLERTRDLLTAYLKVAKGIIFTYDVTNLDSILELTDVMAIVYQVEKFVGIIVGLKCDAEDKREVPTAQALEFAARHGMKLFEASALTGQNVKEVFHALCRDLLSLVEEDPLPVHSNQKIFRRQMKKKLPMKYAMKPTKDLLHELKQLGLETSSDLQDVMKYGSYRCFWCRIFLVGQFGVGKSTLAKVLVGDPLPDTRETTNGIWIYMGKAGMSIKDREWIYMPQGNSKIDTISGMLLSLNYNNINFPGYTKVDTEAQGSSDDSRTKVDTEAQGSSDDARTNEALRIHQANDKSSNTEDKTWSQSRADSCQDRKPKSECLISDPEVGDVTKKSKGSGMLFKEKSGEMYSTLNMLIIDAIREGKFKQKIVPFDIWDFGGQKEFYLTHQLFITSRGVFVLMFNGSKDLRVNVALMQEPFYKNTSEAAYLLVWVNSILTYCPKLVNGFPKIVLVATHKDKVSSNKQEVKRKQLISSLEQLFKDHSGMAHLEFRDLLFINTNDPDDPDIAVLRQRLIQRAFEHPRWGEEMPTAWVPLEIQIAERVEKGVNIISKEELSEMNRNNQIMVLTEEQLEMFLKVQHSLGKLVYLDDVNLRSFIIINPVFLVDVLRSLVTEEQFWPQGPPYDRILRSVCETGLIKQDDILLLWQQEQFKTFLPNKQYLLDMLTHLDVLVIPQTGDGPINQAEESVVPVVPFHMLPSMVQKQDDTSYLYKRCLPHTAIIMAYRFTGEIIPPALTFRFLASLMNMWNVKIYESRRMLFSDLVVVEVDDEHDVAVQVKGKRVIVSLIHSLNVNNLSPTLASTVQECLTASIHRISEFYTGLAGNVDEDSRQEVTIPFEIDFGVVCQSLFGFRKTVCFFPHCDIPSTGDSVWRCFHGTTHYVKNLSLWFAEKVFSGQCQENCKGLGRLELEQCPLDKHIRRVAAEISPYKCREVIIHLGVTVNTWENLEYKYNNQNPDDLKFMALYTWKEANKMASFYDLAKALRESDVSEHVLCKVFKDINLPQEYDLDKLSKEPTRKLLRRVSNHIGDSCLQLGIELELDVFDLENIRYQYRDKLLQQTCVILKQWSRQNPRASVGHLVKAIYRIGKAGCMKGLPL